MEPEQEESPPIYFYCLVNNIPLNFHASDLRNFFAIFIEKGLFDCFHFRHRPQFICAPTGSETDNEKKKTLCSIVRFTSEKNSTLFIKKYHNKFWMDTKGNDMNVKSLITYVKVEPSDEIKFSKELRPPRLMPNGNVGTKNSHFLALIRDCRLPPSLIHKLGLEFPTARRFKKFSKVPYDYQTDVVHLEETEEEVVTGKGHTISDVFIGPQNVPTTDVQNVDLSDSESGPDDDDDRCEDWERHITTVDDHTSQDRIKERLYEEPAELVWEKGTPGIVWYTDAQFWEELKGGFDEQTSDNLDIDMDIYYEEGAGDKDARDMMQMRQSARFRNSMESFSVFKRPSSPTTSKMSSSSRKRPAMSSTTFNSAENGEEEEEQHSFEKYSKGVARKIMEECGWKEGKGLGKSTVGITEAISSDGQNPRDKRGFGYYGEKIEYGSTKESRNFLPRKDDYDDEHRVSIGTVYDDPQTLDSEEPLLRSNSIAHIKRY